MLNLGRDWDGGKLSNILQKLWEGFGKGSSVQDEGEEQGGERRKICLLSTSLGATMVGKSLALG